MGQPLGRTATISPVADTVTYIICMRWGRESLLVRSQLVSLWSRARGRGIERERAVAATCNTKQMNDWWVVPRDRWLDVIRARSIGKQLVRNSATRCATS